MLNSIRFQLRPTVAHPPDQGVAIWIDGENLMDTICRLEAPWWRAIDAPQPDGHYVWVPARIALLPSRHLLGEPADGWCGEFSPVLVCNCGEYACRAYAPRIQTSEKLVSWLSWAEFPPDESRLRDLLPSFVFDIADYLRELQRVSEEYQQRTHILPPPSIARTPEG